MRCGTVTTGHGLSGERLKEIKEITKGSAESMPYLSFVLCKMWGMDIIIKRGAMFFEL